MPEAMSGPPDDAYGRVTNPERYRWLHDVAHGIIRQLDELFDVVVERGTDLDPDLAAGFTPEEMIGVTPRAPEAAPMMFSFTAFPGLHIRAGQWHVVALPACGCDACDEQPDELIERLQEWAVAVPAGRFEERYDGRTAQFSVDFGDGHRSSGGHVVTDAERAAFGQPGERHWQPWPRRR